MVYHQLRRISYKYSIFLLHLIRRANNNFMRDKMRNIIRNIALGAITTLASTSGVNNVHAIDLKIDLDNEIDQNNLNENQPKDLTPKLRFKKITNSNEWEVVSHRSHRSHSSHSSHRSSSGSGSYSRPSSSGSYSIPSPSSSSTNYSLGARTLKKFMIGTDVTELVKILIAKGYLVAPDGYIIETRETFTVIIENAVIQFQKDNNLTADGIVGPTTIYYLKK